MRLHPVAETAFARIHSAVVWTPAGEGRRVVNTIGRNSRRQGAVTGDGAGTAGGTPTPTANPGGCIKGFAMA